MTTLRYVRRRSQARLSLKKNHVPPSIRTPPASRSPARVCAQLSTRVCARSLNRRCHLCSVPGSTGGVTACSRAYAPQGLHPVPTVVKEPWGSPLHRRAAAALHAGSKHPIVEVRGFEPLTYGLQSHRSSRLSYTPGRTIRETNSITSKTGEADLPDFSSFNKKQKREVGDGTHSRSCRPALGCSTRR